MTQSDAMLQSHSALHPASPEAHAIASLWWWMLAAGVAVWLLVMIVAFLAARPTAASVRSAVGATPIENRHRKIVYLVGSATASTVVILASFLVYDFRVGRRLVDTTPPALTISVAGHQWWWEFTYLDARPDKQLVVANELHIPAGVPVRFVLNASDVIHSFWLPSMNGKHDLVPGRQSVVQFQADTVGTYRGQCAEFCGMQHAKMAFIVVAESNDNFRHWLDEQRAPAIAIDSASQTSASRAVPRDSTVAFGRELFLARSCALCHAVRGTDAAAHVAPDLTHFGSRLTIAAGSIPNTFENLSHWIANPDGVKPGTQMPSTPLTQRELFALTTYVSTLK